MSTIIVISHPEAIHLISDAGSYDDAGKLTEIGSKIMTFDNGSVMHRRGFGGDWPQMLYRRLYDVPTFDRMLAELPTLAAYVHWRCAEDGWKEAHGPFEITLAGYSHSAGRMACVQLSSGAGEANGPPFFKPCSTAPFELVEAPALLVAPAIDLKATLGRVPTIESIQPALDGLAMIEAQRADRGRFSRVGFGVAGGFAELTTVTAAGTMRRRLREWPDRVGAAAGAYGDDPVPMALGDLSHEATRSAA